MAVLGLGEAGSEIAGGLVAAGATVRGYDPRVRPGPGLIACSSEAEASTGADLVLSVNSAHDALDALRAGVEALPPVAVWADLNTGSPRLKERLAALAADHRRSFADVALMSPVPGRGLRTPMLASGHGASGYSALLTPLGANIEVLQGAAGVAAARKLLRSVFYKGMAASAVEALAAARRTGQEQWLRAHISEELEQATAETLVRLETGTYRHARRRSEEMRAAAELLRDLGIAPHMSAASAALLGDLLQTTADS
ncbi:DUF1932 domain-containing protein [Acidiferrimicrobium sp. IK]|uniref:NAD(P)-dependent oxidoreductase n=1 Tax=Acidiferrimicrobium sp. IK TaxID=2871700 RepID=UPI0021CAF127|nr:DUF1932 domain-containing protein [Acidiferrimicrobium sp. IK]MCU4184224.1 DUF1932 domain-containing protein [Acidiferrimicrobium sp. IK]